MLSYSLLAVLAIGLLAYIYGRSRAAALAGDQPSSFHSRPYYHGFYSALVTLLCGFFVAITFLLLANYAIDQKLQSSLPADTLQRPQIEQNFIVSSAKSIAMGDVVGETQTERDNEVRQQLANDYKVYTQWRDWGLLITTLLVAVLAFFYTTKQVAHRFRARNRSESIVSAILMVSAIIAILTTVGILFSLIGETLNFFLHVPVQKFLLGTHWSPLDGVFEGKVNEDTVGILPLFAGTLLITVIAMFVAVPIGLFAAIYLSDFASSTTRAFAKPLLEILAGVPTVVYGFFAAITIAPIIRLLGENVGLDVASQSALAAGLVMGIMIIPFISSLSDDVINAVPQALRDGSYGLGATKAETITKVVIPAALPGIVSAIILAVSRAVGETMIVVMAAGQSANLTANPLEAVTTVTVQIVMLITGDIAADTASGPAFSLGFTLFVITLLLNIIALRIVRAYREKYD